MASPTDPVNPAAPEAVAWPGQSWALDGTDPAVPDFRPTHVVPRAGLPAWETPGAELPTVPLDPFLPVRLDERRGDWGRVVCSNGWAAWVDARLLVSVPADPPAAAQPGARTADPRRLLGRAEEAVARYREAVEALAGAERTARGSAAARPGCGWAWSSRASRCGCTTRSTSAGCTATAPNWPRTRPRPPSLAQPVPAGAGEHGDVAERDGTGTDQAAGEAAEADGAGQAGDADRSGASAAAAGNADAAGSPGDTGLSGQADRAGTGEDATRTEGAPPDTAGTADHGDGNGNGNGAETSAGDGQTERAHEAADAGGPGEAGDCAEAGDAGDAREAREAGWGRRGGADEDDGRSGPARESGAPAQQQAAGHEPTRVVDVAGTAATPQEPTRMMEPPTEHHTDDPAGTQDEDTAGAGSVTRGQEPTRVLEAPDEDRGEGVR
ncbi:hypothetical protein [Streptomyces sp. CC228A]|uniref:hypothetical protein n=1 Tax=Streptomyces sp. CC228A TaxID=2898186 RepID=UPI0035A83369